MTSHPLPIIELRDISLCYDSRERPVLEDINLGIHRGDFVAITGPNGGGKTSLLRIILRLLKPSSGQVIYRRDNRDVRCLPIGYLPQKSMIDARFPITVREVILSGLLKNMWGRYNADDIRRLNYIMELTGTSAVAHHPIGELSGGQLQRTLLGRAIISDPEILVLDNRCLMSTRLLNSRYTESWKSCHNTPP